MEQKELLTLIGKCRTGDPDAQEKLVVETQNRVYYHCKKFLKNEQDAQDATQDVLITMLTGLDKLREPAAFWGWLNGITANRCKHLLTQGTKEWQIPEDEEGNSMLDSIETLDDQTVPDKAIDNAETQRLVMDIIDNLPAEQRMTVTFFYYDEMSVKAIAQAMDVSEGTVKSRLNYARKAIKLEVEKLEKKDGTKLYSVSILPFLAYFLRRSAQSQTLSPAAASAITQGALAGAAPAAGASAVAATATAAAVATKTGLGLGTKLVIGLVAAALVGGAAFGGMTLAKHVSEAPFAQEDRDDDRDEADTQSPEPTTQPDPMDELAPAYTAQVEELMARYGDTHQYGLVYIDEDDIPELVVSDLYAEHANVYAYAGDGAFRTVQEDWTSGRLGVPLYYPGKNIIALQYSGMDSASSTYYRINQAGEVEEIARETIDGPWGITQEGELPPSVTVQGELPEADITMAQQLKGDATAAELLEHLSRYTAPMPEEKEADNNGQDIRSDLFPSPQVDFDFTPYQGVYADAGWSTNRTPLEDLTLHSDGSLTGDGNEPSRYGNAPFRLLSGSDSEGGAGSYTLVLYEGTQDFGDYEVSETAYYIIYPAGVSDRVGGDTSKTRIFFVDLVGGAWEGLYIKKD